MLIPDSILDRLLTRPLLRPSHWPSLVGLMKLPLSPATVIKASRKSEYLNIGASVGPPPYFSVAISTAPFAVASLSPITSRHWYSTAAKALRFGSCCWVRSIVSQGSGSPSQSSASRTKRDHSSKEPSGVF